MNKRKAEPTAPPSAKKVLMGVAAKNAKRKQVADHGVQKKPRTDGDTGLGGDEEMNHNTMYYHKIQAMKRAGLNPCTADMEARPFPMDDFEINGINQIILLVGKRRTGKSWWVRDYLYTYRHYFPYGFIFTKTKLNGWYQKFFPNALIFTDYDEELVERLIKLQEKRMTMEGINPNVFMLFDDFAAENTRYLHTFIQLAVYGRHWGITTIFTTQRMFLSGTTIRNNADKIVIFYTPELKTIKSVSEEWGGEWVSDDDFQIFMAKHTRDNGCIVIDNKTTEDRGADRVYVYKAQDLTDKKFTLLCEAAWGGDKYKKVQSQRKIFKGPVSNDYKPSTLMRYKDESGIDKRLFQEDDEIGKKLHEQDTELKTIVGGKSHAISPLDGGKKDIFAGLI